jgi:3-phenylpropionate/cinnamic acid dioxygenase small subunit
MDIAAQFKVQDLNARYAEAIDDNKLEAWPDFFVENGRYRVTTAENVERNLPLGLIYATSRAMLRDRVRSLRDANVYEAQRYRHVIGAPRWIWISLTGCRARYRFSPMSVLRANT